MSTTIASAAPRNHLYLVDGSSYIFRAYHRLPPLTNPQGVPVGAVYGYTAMLWKLADGLDKADGPTHLAVILDHSSHSFRNDLYDEYKANRPEPPEDLRPQFPLIRDATRAFSLPCIELEGYEADDLIAAYACAARDADWDVTIVSSDKDLMQLIEDHGADQPGIDMLDTMKNARIGRAEVIEKFGVGPELVGDVLALMGDSVDNVPGVTGVGPKTASKLINEHGDLEGVLAAAPGMKPGKLRDNLIEQAEMARLSRRLVELDRSCPMPQPLDTLKLDGIPPDPLREFLTFHGFRSMAARVGGETPAPRAAAMEGGVLGEKPVAGAAPVAALPEWPAIDRSLYETVTTIEALDRWIDRARSIGQVAIDTETDALDAVTGGLVGISLSTGAGEACYIPLGHGGHDLLSEKPLQIPLADAIAKLKPLLADDSVLKIGHNPEI
jgi:DNA polymerase I